MSFPYLLGIPCLSLSYKGIKCACFNVCSLHDLLTYYNRNKHIQRYSVHPLPPKKGQICWQHRIATPGSM